MRTKYLYHALRVGKSLRRDLSINTFFKIFASCCACLFSNRLPTFAVRHSSVTELSAAFKGGVLAQTPFTKHGLANQHLAFHTQEPHSANLHGLLHLLSIVAFFEILGSRMCNGVAQTTAACSPKTQKPQKTQEMDVLYIGPLTARERGRLPLRRPENHPNRTD